MNHSVLVYNFALIWNNYGIGHLDARKAAILQICVTVNTEQMSHSGIGLYWLEIRKNSALLAGILQSKQTVSEMV